MANKLESRGYVLKQNAFLKLYIYRYIDQQKAYGSQYLRDLQANFQMLGYRPTHTALYNILHEMTHEGHVTRETKIKGDPKVDFQEIIFYKLTDKGQEAYSLYKKQLKVELERSRNLLDKALRDIYGPVS